MAWPSSVFAVNYSQYAGMMWEVSHLTYRYAIRVAWNKVGAIRTDTWIPSHEVVECDIELGKDAGTRTPDIGSHTQSAGHISRCLPTKQGGLLAQQILRLYGAEPNVVEDRCKGTTGHD